MSRIAALVVLALLAAPAAPAALGAGKPLYATITAQSHHPVVGKTWSYKVTVTDAAGKPVACTIHLQMLLRPAYIPVGEVGRHTVKNGVWRETIPAKGPDAFPLAAVGQPLALQATVTAKGYAAAKARWKIAVVKR